MKEHADGRRVGPSSRTAGRRPAGRRRGPNGRRRPPPLNQARQVAACDRHGSGGPAGRRMAPTEYTCILRTAAGPPHWALKPDGGPNRLPLNQARQDGRRTGPRACGPTATLNEAGAGAPAASALPGAKSQAHKSSATVKGWAPHAAAVEGVEIPPPRPRGMTDKKRVVQEWNGARFVRPRSFLAAIEQIVNRPHRNDMVKIGAVGKMSSGRTTLAAA